MFAHCDPSSGPLLQLLWQKTILCFWLSRRVLWCDRVNVRMQRCRCCLDRAHTAGVENKRGNAWAKVVGMSVSQSESLMKAEPIIVQDQPLLITFHYLITGHITYSSPQNVNNHKILLDFNTSNCWIELWQKCHLLVMWQPAFVCLAMTKIIQNVLNRF